MGRLLIPVVFLVFVAGCGTDAPFSRGDKKRTHGDVNEKPTSPEPSEGADARALFEETVRPVLRKDCSGCHSGDFDGLESVMIHVKPGSPIDSPLYTKPRGINHGGGTIWRASDESARTLEQWISSLK